MKLLPLGKRNKWIYFIFLSIFRNFVALKGGGLFRKVS